MVFGEDVAVKGGVYGVTRGLLKKAGAARVFDTVLDEQSILGLALGAGVTGLLPVPEIQYLAYLHNAEDQIRGEAATMQFFSKGQFRNPAVIRVAGTATSKGSAATSTTTTRSVCSGTSPASSSPRRAARTTPRPCCAAAPPPRRPTAVSVSSWSRSRSTTPGTCMKTGTPGGSRRTRRRQVARDHVPLGRGRTSATAAD